MPACANALFYAGRGLLLHAILHGPWAREPTRIAVLLYPPPYFSKKNGAHISSPHNHSTQIGHFTAYNFAWDLGKGNQPGLLSTPPPYVPKWEDLLQAFYMGFGHKKIFETASNKRSLGSCKIMKVANVCSEIPFLKPLFCPVG